MSFFHSTIAGLTIGSLAFSPAVAQTPAPSAVPSPSASPTIGSVLQSTLKNGMRVVVVPNKLAPVVTTSLTYGIGSDDDTIPGIAHATEHMLFRGTNDVSSDQFADIATRTGAEYNAETTNQYTRYYFTMPSAYLPVALHLEADRMTKAAMLSQDWKTERGAIEQEVRAHQSSPLYGVSQRLQAFFFGDTPYATDALGTIAGFDRMTAADIASFYHTWYHPNNATLVISGDVDAKATLAATEAAFEGIPAASLPQHRPIEITPVKATTIAQKIDFPVPIVALGFRLPGSNDKDYAATEVLFAALNNGRSDLTGLALQGKVLGAFGVASAYPEVGFGMLLGIARPGSDTKTAIADLRSVIDTYAKSGVPPEFVDAARTRLLASKAYAAASIPGQAFDWSLALAEGQSSPDATYDSYASVTVDDVNRVLKKYVAAGEQVTMDLAATNGAAVPRQDLRAGKENVQVTATKSTRLPVWATPYFSAALRAPRVDDKAKTTKLSNGLVLSVRREQFSPTVVLTAQIRTSPQLYEPGGKDGVASITSGLLPYGTTTYDYKNYQAQLDAIAANVSLGTDFALTVRAEDFDRAIALLADGELHPAFDPSYFALVQKNALQTTAAMQGRPETQAMIARLNAIYAKGDPRRRRATEQTVSSITLGDVKKWYGFAYRPDLTTMSIVGDVDPQHAREIVNRYFGEWKARGNKPDFKYPRLKRTDNATSVTVKSASAKQSNVTLTQAIALHRDDRDVVALELANTILSGEGTGSLLFRTVREAKGYVYTIDSSFDVNRSGATFSIDFASDPKNVEHAQTAALAEIERMRHEVLPLETVQQAKALLIARDIVRLDTYSGVAADLLSSAESGVDANETYRYYARLLSTTPENLRDAMRRWIDPAHLNRVVVAPE